MSNVIPLFKSETSRKDNVLDVVSTITDLAERQGIDITDPVFRIQLNTVATMVQLTFNESKKV